MKPNINDVSKLRDLKDVLAGKNVSPTAIVTIEKALKNGMSFNGPQDLALLDIPGVDASALREAVVFGPRTIFVPNIKTVEYRFMPIGEAKYFYGYQLLVRTIQGNGFTSTESFPIDGDNRVVVDYDLAVLQPGSKVVLAAKTPQGARTTLKPHDTDAEPLEELEVAVDALANTVLDIAVVPLSQAPNPSVIETYPVKGKLLSKGAEDKLDGYQLVIFASLEGMDEAQEWLAVATASTETNGYFVTSPLLFNDPSDLHRVKAAKALVSKDQFSAELPIKLAVTLVDGEPAITRIPERVILVIEDVSPPAAGTDGDAGCSLDFHEKKVLEECSYYTVVRTSEPSIIADVLEDEPDIDLQDLFGVPGFVPLSVLRKYHEIQKRSTALKPAARDVAATTDVAGASGNVVLARSVSGSVTGPVADSMVATTGDNATPITLPAAKSAIFNRDLMNRLLVDYKTEIVVKGTDKPRFRGRAHLGPHNQIDWDDTPTIFQAASIAHGHLLHFKQEWVADGYSIGDLVYSLPLAPGQKKQIAVLDWERRESAANSQTLDYEETLNNSLLRDRDISEVISGTLTENIRGNSKSSTRGLGFGFGSSVMGIIPGVGTFGSLLGISGGMSSASASAGQSALRDMTSSSLQSITDRTQQAASVVRSQRATVVQTVSQGERVQATAESVANYNHCHAITIQYFEVLRHFSVRNRLAGVQECLFVPLPLTRFDLEKCLRWRTSLERHLFRTELRSAFAAVARIQNERESAFENYYDSIGYPRRNFAEQAVRVLSGELFMEFFFFNTNMEKIDDAIVQFFSFFGISLDALRDRKITDEELARHVGPRTIEFLLDAFTVQTDKGQDLRLDLSLVSSFRQSVPLRVSVRQSAQTPRHIRRQDIEAITVKLDLNRLAPDVASNLQQFQNKYMKIRLRSGHLRYRTDGLAGTLFSGSIDNDIFAGSDAAYMPTPLNDAELRNPRGEDVEAANALIQHLNENLEYYNRCLLFDMTPERRFMLLDGIVAPGKAQGRSVASVVENRVIGIAGNSLIMPVAPGFQLDPTIDETFDLFAQYYNEDPEPMRVSLPTRGVYAEAVMGQCNSCEVKDETRFWRWEESPIPDSPNTQILPLNTDTRRADPGDLQAKDFPAPVVNIQNAPALPDPTGMQTLLQTLGKGDVFRDLTGLQQTQLNAMSAYQQALESAGKFGKEAADLAKTMAHVQLAKDAQRSGALKNEEAGEIIMEHLKKPEPEKLREEIDKDLEQLKDQTEKGNLDEAQQKELSEEVYRKKQNVPRTRSTPKKGKRKYRLTLMIQDPNGKSIEGTWVLSFGSLRDEGFETDTTPSGSTKVFDVELDTTQDNIFEFKGNPVLLGQSFPPGSEYYYHYLRVFPVVGTNPNLSFTISQTRRRKTITASHTESEADVKMRAVAEESGTQRDYSVESGALAQLVAGKVAAKITFFGKKTVTTTEGGTETTSDTDTVTYEVDLLASRLAIKQVGQIQDRIDVED